MSEETEGPTPRPPVHVSLIAGAVAALVFVPLSELFWAGDALSLIVPQALTLGPALAVALWAPERRAKWWLHVLAVAAMFYGLWLVAFYGYHLVSPPEMD